MDTFFGESSREVSSARAISNGRCESACTKYSRREEVQLFYRKMFLVIRSNYIIQQSSCLQKDILILSDTEVCHAHHIASGSKILTVTCYVDHCLFRRCSVYDLADGRWFNLFGVNDLICVRIDQKCSAFADKIADMFKHLAVIF